MIKKMISHLSMLAMLITFMASCSQSMEYTNVIPSDASLLFAIDLKTLAEKAGATDKENEAMQQKMLDAFKSGMEINTYEQVEKVIRNPNESGIDMNSPVYFFTAPTFPHITLVAKMSNEDRLQSSLDLMVKEQVIQPVTEADGYKISTMNNVGLMAFNSTTVMFVQTFSDTDLEEVKKKIADLMKQPVEKSIHESNLYKQMKKYNGDISFFGSMSALPKIYTQQASMGLPPNVDLKDISIIGSLNFEKGKIVTKVENYSDNPEMKALMGKQLKTVKTPTEMFVKYFPVSTLAFLNMGVNGSEIYNTLKENGNFREFISGTNENDIKELINSFDGDITMGLTNVTMDNSPTFVAYAKVKSSKALETFYQKKETFGLSKKHEIVQLEKDEYVFKGTGMNIFFGVKDNQMYVTNDEMTYKNIDKVSEKSIKEASFASSMKGKSSFVVINVEAIMDLPVVKMMTGFGNEEIQMYIKLLSSISYLSASSEKEKGQMEIVLKDKETNALKQIVDFAKQFAGM